jgi:arylsulfatase A-like enzyme
MAEEGMLFSAAYASPVGSPTRISLLTGMNAARHAVTTTVSAVDTEFSVQPDGTLTEAKWACNGLQPPETQASGVTRNAFNHPDRVYPATELVAYTLQQPYCCAQTLPMLLKGVGYYSILAGKAHLGAGNGFGVSDVVTPGQNPHLLGFDLNLRGEEDVTSERAVAILTRAALKAADEQETTRPLFLYLSPFALQKGNVTQTSLREAPEDGLPWNLDEQHYCDFIQALDVSLGEVLEWALDRKTRTGRDVLLIFMGDNGRRLREGATLAELNEPLRGGRGSCYEGGIRVPLLAWMPGKVKAGAVSHTPVASEDLFSTLLDYAGIEEVSPLECAQTPADVSVCGQLRLQKIDGVSLRELLEEPRVRELSRVVLTHYPHPGQPGFMTALRMGEWKLIWNHATGEKELYNVVSDISEEKNQAKKRPSLVAKLSREMSKLLRERGAQLPTLGGVPIALPDEGAHHK